MHKPERLARETIYTCPWFTLHADRVQLPGGRIAERYHVMEMAHEAAGAVVDDGADNVLLVHSYRYPTDSVQWEVPAGGLEAGESPEEAALREALEESGHICADPRLVYVYYPMNGISTSTFNIVRARAVGAVDACDENEVAEWRWFSRAEIESMLAAGELHDGFSLVALLLWLREGPGA